jgi:hypothetical protein
MRLVKIALALWEEGFEMVDVQDESKDYTEHPERRHVVGQEWLPASGTKMFAISFALLAFVCVLIGSAYVYTEILSKESIADSKFFPSSRGPDSEPDVYVVQAFVMIFERFLPLALISLFAIAFTRVSISFIKSSEYGNTGVVSSKDLPLLEEAIKQGKPEPIDQYIRLASLTGGIGVFQKIGLTGLPLITLLLVLLFSFGISLASDGSERFKAFLDFEKLTLGAFIGSFVQRQVERRGQEAEIQRAIDTVSKKPVAPPNGTEGVQTK